MSARTDLGALLEMSLPDGWDLYDYPRPVDNLEPGRPVVLFESWKIVPHPIPSRRVTEFTLALLAPETDPEAEGALDANIETLLGILDQLAGQFLIRWDDATRATYRSQFPAYQVTVAIDTEKD